MISRQSQSLELARSTYYYKPVPGRDFIQAFMARIDVIYLEDPTSGSRRILHYLSREGTSISLA